MQHFFFQKWYTACSKWCEQWGIFPRPAWTSEIVHCFPEYVLWLFEDFWTTLHVATIIHWRSHCWSWEQSSSKVKHCWMRDSHIISLILKGYHLGHKRLISRYHARASTILVHKWTLDVLHWCVWIESLEAAPFLCTWWLSVFTGRYVLCVPSALLRTKLHCLSKLSSHEVENL